MLATANTGKTQEKFREKNAGEWTERVEISEEEISGSKRGTCGCILTYFMLYRENLEVVSFQQMEL